MPRKDLFDRGDRVFPLLQVLYIPASVLGGIVGLCLILLCSHFVNNPQWFEGDAGVAVHHTLAWYATDVVDLLRGWPGWLIAVIFAGLLLERSGKSLRNSLKFAARQGIVVWIIVVGEVTIGLAAMWLVILQSKTFANLPGSFGQLIETGFAGGHGTAAAMGDVFADMLGFEQGRDLGFVFATVGLVFGVVTGIVYVNIAVRCGWTRRGDVEIARLTGLEARREPKPVAFARVRSEVIDPLVFQVLILAVAFAIGLATQWVFNQAMPFVIDLFEPVAGLNKEIEEFRTVRADILKFSGKLPLFMFTLVGGLLVREAMYLLRIGDLIDPQSIKLIMAAAMEFLIVAAITSLKVDAILRFGWPVLLLLVLGFVWTGFCLFFIARRLLPRAYWFELGILNYGMSTGTTAQGMMLLRIIDKDLESGAAEDYALAAPLSAPFIGGGVITIIVLPYALQHVHIGWVVAVLAAVMAGLYALGAMMAEKGTPDSA